MNLFSVVVLCYRNFEYLYEAIQSVLSQDYPQIEIIVSDDASDGFPYQDIKEYIDSHKSKNVISVKIRRETENQGTVRHLNHNIQEATGKYICFLAADDVFYDEKTLSRYVQGFTHAKEDTLVEMAQTAMYDHGLQNMEEYYLRPNVQKILEAGPDYHQLYCTLCYSACLPSTSTCFKTEFFERYGKFDESYWLIEDVPLHLKIAREQIPLHFENFVAIRHRSGGISHGANKALSKTKLKYFQDIIRYHDTVKKELNQYAPEIKKEICLKYRHERIWLDYQMYGGNGIKGKLKLLALHPGYCFYMAMMLYDRALGKLSVGGLWGALIITASLSSIAEAIFFLFGIRMESVLQVGYGLCLLAIVVSAIGSILHFVASGIKRVAEFPSELLWLMS